jgi:hypothetical protein
MAKLFTPIKVKIGLRADGNADYPDFNILNAVKEQNMDWSYYVDKFGLGWIYDKLIGHQEEAPDSPLGQQLGVLIVEKEFANEAILSFPVKCSKLTEVELEDFYDNRHAIEFQDEDVDREVLDVIKVKQDLGQPLTPQQIKALDPDDDTIGIRKNKKKTWVDFKALKGIEIEKTARY